MAIANKMTIDELIDNYFDDECSLDEERLLSNSIEYQRVGGDVNAVSKSGMRLIDLAVGDGLLGLIEWLVEQGANLNSADPEGWFPILLAVDADIDSAIQNNHELSFRTTKYLVDLGVDIGVRTPDGKGISDIVNGYGRKAAAKFDELVGPIEL